VFQSVPLCFPPLRAESPHGGGGGGGGGGGKQFFPPFLSFSRSVFLFFSYPAMQRDLAGGVAVELFALGNADAPSKLFLGK